jgi:phospho-N-acetylmuramoyl-pentapeptide-transferase
MISDFLLNFVNEITLLNLFKYISVRSVLAGATAFMVALCLGPWLIRSLRRWGYGEKVEKGDSAELDSLHASKENTPTMGGLLFLISAVFGVLCWGKLDQSFLMVGVLVMLLSGGIGFIDDYLKLRKKGGLRGSVKLLLLCLVATGTCLYLLKLDAGYGQLHFPFFKEFSLDLGVFYPMLAVMVFAGTANAVNLSDGLDGLAIGSFLPLAGAFAIIAYLAGHLDFSAYLFIPYVEGAGELTVLLASLLGAGLGFLWFNCHPAEIFMGDTGSLALGAIVGYVSLVLRQELVLLMAGGVFVVEALSVILQVTSFKLTGKRIFKCSPLHHHYQFMGVAENKITVRFWIIGTIMAVLALLTLKVR